mmetsp:Transcript_23641/g.28865  ORF Transcript_23641/g.28865 Transcript_23641/m.28865 type:complete len:112 (-) Transcript_23641:137-472(-)
MQLEDSNETIDVNSEGHALALISTQAQVRPACMRDGKAKEASMRGYKARLETMTVVLDNIILQQKAMKLDNFIATKVLFLKEAKRFIEAVLLRSSNDITNGCATANPVEPH